MLNGKVAVVTGAGNGIGRAIAIDYARLGASVVVNDLGASLDGRESVQSAAQQLVEEIKSAGGRAVANVDSVADSKGAARIIETALDHFGKIDIVLNNAGIVRDKLFFHLSDEDFDAVLKVHLYGTFYISRAAALHFREQQSGSFIHMTSNSALIGNLGQGNYCAAKLGIVGLSKSIALEMKKYNVRSNCIAPVAWSRMTKSIPSKTPEQQAYVEKIKKMTPETIAPLASFLGSDAAADVSGQVFAIRRNEVFLMSQARPVRSVHNSEGWTAESIATTAMPAMRPSFFGLDKTSEVFAWDPI